MTYPAGQNCVGMSYVPCCCRQPLFLSCHNPPLLAVALIAQSRSMSRFVGSTGPRLAFFSNSSNRFSKMSFCAFSAARVFSNSDSRFLASSFIRCSASSRFLTCRLLSGGPKWTTDREVTLIVSRAEQQGQRISNSSSFAISSTYLQASSPRTSFPYRLALQQFAFGFRSAIFGGGRVA